MYLCLMCIIIMKQFIIYFHSSNSVYKGKHSKRYEIGDNVLGNRSVLAFPDSSSKGHGGITNMVALDKDENMGFEDDNNDDTMEEPVSSSVF